MIKLLIDENIPPALIHFLRDRGFDLKATQGSVAPGCSDSAIMELARQEERALLTFDKHFANILLYPPHTHSGVIRIRLHPPVLEDISQALENFFKNFDLTKMEGTLIIIERDGFRVRRSA